MCATNGTICCSMLYNSSVLQCVVCKAKCAATQHTATNCYTLQHTATHWKERWHNNGVIFSHNAAPSFTLTLCNTLLNTATHCDTLPHTATHCNTLQRTALHCNTLHHTHHTATHCNTLQHTATHDNSLQHTATHCNTLHKTATHCQTLQHTAIHRSSDVFSINAAPCLISRAVYRRWESAIPTGLTSPWSLISWSLYQAPLASWPSLPPAIETSPRPVPAGPLIS